VGGELGDTEGADAPKPAFKFIRGIEGDAGDCEWPDGAETVRKAIAESLNAKNVAFLLGAGCSSSQTGGIEVGIPTMAPLAKEFARARESDEAAFPTAAERESLSKSFGIDIGAAEYARNLERLMELLFSLRFALKRSSLTDAAEKLKLVESIIKKIQAFLWSKCTNGAFANGDSAILDLYQLFYRKLVLRDRSLPRPWVFTTNYDLFNETAMDRLVIFVDPALDGEIAKLRALNDPRIWIIGGEGPRTGRKAHYFDTIIEEFMPQRPSERIDDAVKKVLEAMSPKKGTTASDDEEAGE
jgi:hypothetical protein